MGTVKVSMRTGKIHYEELVTEQRWDNTVMRSRGSQNGYISLVIVRPDEFHLVTPMSFLEFIVFHIKTSAIFIQHKIFNQIVRKTARTFVAIARTRAFTVIARTRRVRSNLFAAA